MCAPFLENLGNLLGTGGGGQYDLVKEHEYYHRRKGGAGRAPRGSSRGVSCGHPVSLLAYRSPNLLIDPRPEPEIENLRWTWSLPSRELPGNQDRYEGLFSHGIFRFIPQGEVNDHVFNSEDDDTDGNSPISCQEESKKMGGWREQKQCNGDINCNLAISNSQENNILNSHTKNIQNGTKYVGKKVTVMPKKVRHARPRHNSLSAIDLLTPRHLKKSKRRAMLTDWQVGNCPKYQLD